MILHIALTEEGELAECIPGTLFLGDPSCVIRIYHAPEDANTAEALYTQVSTLPQQRISSDDTYYAVDIPVKATQTNTTNPDSRLDMEKGISL